MANIYFKSLKSLKLLISIRGGIKSNTNPSHGSGILPSSYASRNTRNIPI
jgi:hypothetical protein